MFGYATELRGATQGIGEFSMEYKKHSPVAEFEVQDVIDAYAKKRKEGGEDWGHEQHCIFPTLFHKHI